MATVTAKLTLGLPDDNDSDQVKLYVSATETGSFTLDQTLTYSFGQEVIDSIVLDTTKWYKIAFNNTTSSVEGTQSEAVEGADWEKGKPFFAITSFFDSIPFAVPQDVYDASNLSATEYSIVKTQQALKIARAKIDIFLVEQESERYSEIYESGISKRKFNAQMVLIKEAEINYSLGIIFRDLADDQAITEIAAARTLSNIKIGTTSIKHDINKVVTSLMLDNRSKTYEKRGDDLLNTLMPNGIELVYNRLGVNSASKFLHPTSGLRVRLG